MTRSHSDCPHFGSRLKKIHAEKGISQHTVAKTIGMDEGNYCKLLQRPNMNANTLWYVCQALEIGFGDL